MKDKVVWKNELPSLTPLPDNRELLSVQPNLRVTK